MHYRTSQVGHILVLHWVFKVSRYDANTLSVSDELKCLQKRTVNPRFAPGLINFMVNNQIERGVKSRLLIYRIY